MARRPDGQMPAVLALPATQRLREEYSLYAIDSGRICVAAINSRNIDYVARAIASVLIQKQ